jgi:hypothetical protein
LPSLSAAAVGAVAALWLTDTDPGRTSTTLMTAAIALLVAGITAITTDGRQERQLNHEEQALGAQLAHDRIILDLNELRTVLDDARSAAVALVDERWPGLVTLCRDQDPNAGAHLALEWRTSHLEALRHEGRLSLRLGHAHEVTTAYHATLEALWKTVRDIRQMARNRQTDLVESRANSGLREFERALDDFTEKARRKVGSAREILES